MPTPQQLDNFSRIARDYANGRAQDGVGVSAKQIYDRMVACEEEIEARQAKRGGP